MTVTPPQGDPQREPLPTRKPFTVEGLLYLTLGSLAASVTWFNPPVGVAIGVGLAVVGLLVKISS